MRRLVEFKFDIGDAVCIADSPDICGRVLGMCLQREGVTYRVCWWQDGKRFDEWVHEWEIEGVKA